MPADSTVELLATARDAISGTLRKVSRGLSETGDSARDAAVETAELTKTTEMLERQFTDFSNDAVKTIATVDEMNRSVDQLGTEMDLSSRATNDLKKTLREMLRSEQDAILTTETLQDTLRDLAKEGSVAGESVEEIEGELGQLNKRFLSSIVHTREFRDVVEDMADEMTEADIDASKLGRTLGTIANADDIQSVDAFADQVTKLARREGAAEDKAEELGDAIRSVSVAILGDFSPAAGVGIAELYGLEHAADEAEDEVEELAREFGTLGKKAIAWNSTAILSQLALTGLGATAGDTAEEFKELQEAFSELLPENPITTMNLGPVNISLAHMFTTVITLTTVLGPLIATVGALITALGGLVAAAGSFLGLGMLEFLEDIERRFAGIENRAEALEALMKGLGRAARRALSPIMDETIGGMGPTDFFIESIRFGMEILRDFALVVEQLTRGQSGEAIASFFERIGEALTTGDGGVEFVTALENAVESALPLITDFVVFLINNLPEMMEFMTKIADDVGPALANIFLTMLPGLVELVKLGAEVYTMLGKLAGIVGAVVGFFAGLFNWFNNNIYIFGDLASHLRTLIAGLVTFTFIAMTFVSALTTIIGLLKTLPLVLKVVSGLLSILGINLGTVTGSLGSASGAASTFLGILTRVGGMLRWVLSALSALSSISLSTAGGIGVIAAIIGGIIWALGNMDEAMQSITDILEGISDFFTAIAKAIGLSAENARKIGDAMTALFPGLYVIWSILAIIKVLGMIILDQWEKIDGRINSVVKNIKRVQDLWNNGIFNSTEIVAEQRRPGRQGGLRWQQTSNGKPVINITAESGPNDDDALRRVIRNAFIQADRRNSNRTGNRQRTP